MTENDDYALVSNSGYALQIAIAHMVNNTSAATGWGVLYEEQSWKGADREGFIDLVLEHKSKLVVLVIECKRPTKGEWTLLSSSGKGDNRRHIKSLHLDWNAATDAAPAARSGYPIIRTHWESDACEPWTAEATFCIPKNKSGYTIDNIASELVIATDALAKQEQPYLSRQKGKFQRLYIAAIVTTANLRFCAFDPTTVSLADGALPANAKFTEVDAVRYTKQLSTDSSSNASATSARELVDLKERSVLIIRASALQTFLENFVVDRIQGEMGRSRIW